MVLHSVKIHSSLAALKTKAFRRSRSNAVITIYILYLLVERELMTMGVVRMHVHPCLAHYFIYPFQVFVFAFKLNLSLGRQNKHCHFMKNHHILQFLLTFLKLWLPSDFHKIYHFDVIRNITSSDVFTPKKSNKIRFNRDVIFFVF